MPKNPLSLKQRQCMACKEFTDSHTGICKSCQSKKCTQCGKISVQNTQYDDNGFAYCPKCFRMVIQLAIKSSRTNVITIDQRLDSIENRLTLIERMLTNRTAPESRGSQTLPKQEDISQRIDDVLGSMEIPDTIPSVDDIKNKALSLMMESEPDTTSDKD